MLFPERLSDELRASRPELSVEDSKSSTEHEVGYNFKNQSLFWQSVNLYDFVQFIWIWKLVFYKECPNVRISHALIWVFWQKCELFSKPLLVHLFWPGLYVCCNFSRNWLCSFLASAAYRQKTYKNTFMSSGKPHITITSQTWFVLWSLILSLYSCITVRK